MTARFSLTAANAPPAETIQFYDGFFPQLKAGSYTAHLEHVVEGGPSGAPSWSAEQAFTVQGPQFAIDPATVVSVYPPAGSTGDYDLVLPFIVLDDPSLPWERSLVPGDDPPGRSDPTPWLALVVLQERDLCFAAGTTSPLSSGTVADLLLSPSKSVLKPALEDPDPDAICQTITVRGERFSAVMPSSEDIVHLAHCRQTSTTGEAAGLAAVLIANRLAQSPAGETTYYAHLVSLEGLATAIAPGATLPAREGPSESGPKDVMMVSLSAWSFASTAEGAPFSALVEELIASQTASPTLALPTHGASATAAARLKAGYVPLEYGLPSGESTFAWYRGPLTPVAPQPLPSQPGQSSDALLIYSPTEGVFDVSYAAAWQLGRALALADGSFSQSLVRYRQAARVNAALLAQRQAVAHLDGVAPADLLAPNPSRRRLLGALTEGMAERWTAALRGTGSSEGSTAAPTVPARERGADAIRQALDADGSAALQDQLAELQAPVASWLAALSLLAPIPFANIVPAAGMLPAESIRFFYYDATWAAALAAGAMSVGIHGSADVAIAKALQPSLEAAVAAARVGLGVPATPASGMLIRSALVPSWPSLVLSASDGGTPLATVRRETLSSDVLLCLWAGVPDSVSLAEPYQGLRFGIEAAGGGLHQLALREVSSSGEVGKQLPGKTVQVTPVEGRVDVAALAATIGSTLGISTLGAGDLAIQLVLAPERQRFPTAEQVTL